MLKEKRKGTRVKVGYRKVQINDQFYVWKDRFGLKETEYYSGKSLASF